MNYVGWLRWAVIGGLFAVPFLAFVVADGGIGLREQGNFLYIPFASAFFPYITGKNFAFRVLVEILIAAYFLLALREPRYRPRSSYLMWSALSFVVWMGVATLFSFDPIKSLWSNFERMEGYIGLLHLFAYFVIAGAVLTVDKLWERFFYTSVGAGALQGFIALLQVTGGLGFAASSQSGPRADGTFGNATYLAVFLLINFFLALFLLVRLYGLSRRPNPWLQAFFGLALVLTAAGVFFTQTRGAMFGLIAGLVVFGAFILWQAKGVEWRALRKTAIGALGALVVLSGAIFIFRDTAFIQAIPGVGRLASISLTETTVISRLSYVWPIAVKGALERPISGWGQENFSHVFNTNYEPGLYGQEDWFDRAHNQFFDWFIAGGFPAFLLYLSLYFLAAWAIFRSPLKAPEQAAFLGLLAAFGFHNLFVFDHLMSAVCFFAILAFAHGLSRREPPGLMFLSAPVSDRTISIAAPIVLVVLLFSVYQVNAAGYSRSKLLLQALQPGANVSINTELFREAMAKGPHGEQEALEQLMRYASAVYAAAQVSPDQKAEAIALAKEEAERFTANHPLDVRVELLYGSFLAQIGEQEVAFSHLQKALEGSPRKQTVLFQIAQTLLQAGDPAQALTFFKQGFDLYPASDRARIYYAGGLYHAGQIQEGDRVLTERFSTVLVDDDRLLQTYLDTQQFDRAVGVWLERAKKNPDDAQIHVGLATAYYAAGNTNSAIAELEIAARLNPMLAAEIRNVIDQLKNPTPAGAEN